MRQHGGNEQPVKGRRANKPKSRKVSTADSPAADLQKQIGTLTRELKEAREQQTTTSDILKVISRSTFDPQQVFETLTESAVRLCSAERGFVFRFDGQLLRFTVGHNLSPEFRDFLERNPITPGRDSNAGRAAIERRTVHNLDVQSDPKYNYGGSRVDPYRTVLAVPMLKADDLFGVFVIYRHEVRAFTDSQIALMEAFADQAVIAIDNARLFNETKEALERQTATADILDVIARSPSDVQPVFDAIAERSKRLIGGFSSMVLRISGGMAHLAAFTSTGETGDAAVKALYPRPTADIFVFDLLRGGEVVQVEDVETSTKAPERIKELARMRGYRSIIYTPLISKGMLIGIVIVSRKSSGKFEPRHVELLKTFASQAVIAIQNVRLFGELQERTRELSKSLEDLRTAQDRLVQTEKLASLGQLTAGIAHEIKNPLNFVNNFSAVSAELTDELNDVLMQERLTDKGRQEVDELTGLLKDNLDKVVQHGRRADSIVKNMLLHSREGLGERRSADINALVAESLNLAYHGARAEKPGFSIKLNHDLDPEAGVLDLYPQEITRALLNLISNGFYAAMRRKVDADDGVFEPVLSAATRNLGKTVEIRIRDNGTGIPPEVRQKMFNPFFTTKPTGEGTGLGLSMAHDIIVKQHGGRIDVETEPGVFTEFIITLPRDNGTAAGPKPE